MRVLTTVLLLCLPLAVFADDDVSKVNGAVRVSAGQQAGDVGTVNGSVHIEEDVTAKDVDTVNGSINIGARSRVDQISTVNGSITLAEGATARTLESVNGSMTLNKQAEVTGEITTVNGAIRLSAGSVVHGDVENVNGRMKIDGARIDGGLKTTNGDLSIGADSHIKGGITVEKPSFSFFNRNSRNPKIVIGPNAVVEGTLEFEREVDLFISDTAKVGKIEGATPIEFSGTEPGKSDLAVER